MPGQGKRKVTVDGIAIWLNADQARRYADIERVFTALPRELANERNAALRAAAMYLGGRLAPEAMGYDLSMKRRRAAETFRAAEAVAILADEDGMAEAAIARALGVDRGTVHKWLGKA